MPAQRRPKATPAAEPRVLVAHLSDTHVGYRAYRAVSAGGWNQREQDFLDAYLQACRDIVEKDPALVVHSGDVADTPGISFRLVHQIREGLRQLAGVRPDGTRRQVVVVAGNHDLPGARNETCYLDLYDDIEGLTVVTSEYRRVEFDPARGADPALADVVVHAIDHDSLAAVDLDQVLPTAGKVNILLTHGTAGGSDLYRRCVGREYTVPTAVLQRPWAYGALGHWHKQGPVDVSDTGQYGRIDPLRRGRIWYAGSCENSGLGDLADNGRERGYLLVEIPLCVDGQRAPRTPPLPQVEPVNLPIRPMHRLADIDADTMTSEEIRDVLVAQLRELDDTSGLSGAIVAQRVVATSRSLWTLVDIAAVRAAAARTLHHDLRFTVKDASEGGEAALERPGPLAASVESEIDAAAERLLPEKDRLPAASLAKQHVSRRRDRSSRQAQDLQAADPQTTDPATPQDPDGQDGGDGGGATLTP